MRAKNCALFIWTTMPCLPEVFKVIEAWGLNIKHVLSHGLKPKRWSTTGRDGKLYKSKC